MNKHIEIALRTWYPEDHPLHYDPFHPTLALAGEVGEWLNLHKKAMFKPGYELTREAELDELGDIWYYLRIIHYFLGKNEDTQNYNLGFDTGLLHQRTDIKTLMVEMSSLSSEILAEIFDHTYPVHTIWKFAGRFYGRLVQLECTLDEITAINWEKLKPGSERGDQWRKASKVLDNVVK